MFSSVAHRVWLFATPWTVAHQASLSFTTSQNLLKLMSTESMMPSNHLIFCHLLLLFPSIFPRIRVFSSKSVLHIRWLKYWSFSFSISPSYEYSGLISFRIDWFDLQDVHYDLWRVGNQHMNGGRDTNIQTWASWLLHMLVVWSWASYLMTCLVYDYLLLSFLNYKMRTKTILTSWRCGED